MTVAESAIDPTVFPDNQRVDKVDLREQFTIAHDEITELKKFVSVPRQSLFDLDESPVLPTTRPILTSNLTLYATDYGTNQACVDASYKYDLNNYTLTIKAKDGGGAVLFDGAYVGQSGLSPNVIFEGNTTTWAVLIEGTSQNAIEARNGANIYVRGVKLKTTVAGTLLEANRFGRILFDKTDFADCAASQIDASNLGTIEGVDNGAYRISADYANGNFHLHVNETGHFSMSGMTITNTGMTVTKGGFVGVAGKLEYFGAIFVGFGAVTGTRFFVHQWGSILTGTAAIFNYFPGSLVGNCDLGGFYDYTMGPKPGATTNPLEVFNNGTTVNTASQYMVRTGTAGAQAWMNVIENGAGGGSANISAGTALAAFNISATAAGSSLNFYANNTWLWQLFSTAIIPTVNESFDIGGTLLRVRDFYIKNIILYNAGAALNSNVAMTNGAGGLVGTLNTSPVAGNPTKWIGFNDNGTIRYFPCW